MLREKLSMAVLLLAAAQLLQAAEPLLVPTPRASVLAYSATNRPFLAAAKSQQPVDLAARGYAETELLVRGYANIYDWAAAGSREVVVRTANLPYTTRILVRRPQGARRFSGRVIVELLDSSARHESAPLWGLSFEHFLRSGDVWVGVTVKPGAAAALQKFDAVRYAALGFAFRQPEGCAVPGDTEDGLAFDVMAQVGALLRSSSKENPLLGLDPQRLIAAGYAEAGGTITTFANALHARLRLGNRAPIFDGYLNAAGSMVTPINQCAAALPDGDARRAALPRDVPFVTVMTESDFNRAPALRRADSDAERDVFRLYEIAGAAHSGPFAAGIPAQKDLALVGLDLPAAALCREPRSDFPAKFAFNAIWQQFDELLVLQLPMSSVPRIETDASMAPRVDANGNVLGGWRLPQMQLPLARYAGRSTPASDNDQARRSCAMTGAMQRFDAAKLKAQYRDRNEYLRRFNAAVENAVLDGLLVREDAAALKAAAPSGLPVF
jgi:hypothetical protein